jgi:hypothetical protein
MFAEGIVILFLMFDLRVESRMRQQRRRNSPSGETNVIVPSLHHRLFATSIPALSSTSGPKGQTPESIKVTAYRTRRNYRMASKQVTKRLLHELRSYEKDPSDALLHLGPINDQELTHWTAILKGVPATAYQSKYPLPSLVLPFHSI